MQELFWHCELQSEVFFFLHFYLILIYLTFFFYSCITIWAPCFYSRMVVCDQWRGFFFSQMTTLDLAANRFCLLTGFRLLRLTWPPGVITKQCLCCCTPQSLGLSKEVQGLNWECVGRAIFLGALFSNSPIVQFLPKYHHPNLQLSRPPNTGVWLKL